MNIHDLNGKTVALLASGGLDSCTIVHWLANNGVNVITITADLGQPDEPNLEVVKNRLLASGATEAVVVDAKEYLAEMGLLAIMAQARYEGDYWNTTGLARYVTVEAAINVMKERDISVLAHGATGRGNDQVRFQIATNMVDPEIEVYAPWRDRVFLDTFGGRKEMIDYCLKNNVPIQQSHEKPYSTDANMLGLTHEAGNLESPETPAHAVVPEMGVLPREAPDKEELFSVEFDEGQPISINGKEMANVIEAILSANKIGGRNAIGICSHLVENRFVGLKSRGVYEAPGMELLGKCFEYLLQYILDRDTRELYDSLSLYVGKQVYNGYLLGTGGTAAARTIGELMSIIGHGTITVSLYKGTISYVSFKKSEHGNCSLYSQEDASMENEGAFNHADAEGFLRVLGMRAKALSKQYKALN
jgi:argininosuccinate synthase